MTTQEKPKAPAAPAPSQGVSPTLLIETLKAQTAAVNKLAAAFTEAIAPALAQYAEATRLNAQGVSLNFYMRNGNGESMQVTVRRPDADQWEDALGVRNAVMATLAEQGWQSGGESRGNTVVVNAAPAQAAPDSSGMPLGTHDFIVDTVVLSTAEDGTPVYRGKGYPFAKWGVRIWPEILPRLGIDPDTLKAGPNVLPRAIAVHYVPNEEGQPKKIVGLATGETLTEDKPDAQE